MACMKSLASPRTTDDMRDSPSARSDMEQTSASRIVVCASIALRDDVRLSFQPFRTEHKSYPDIRIYTVDRK